MFYGSGIMALPYDLHLNGYQGHIDIFKVIREKEYHLEATLVMDT